MESGTPESAAARSAEYAPLEEDTTQRYSTLILRSSFRGRVLRCSAWARRPLSTRSSDVAPSCEAAARAAKERPADPGTARADLYAVHKKCGSQARAGCVRASGPPRSGSCIALVRPLVSLVADGDARPLRPLAPVDRLLPTRRSSKVAPMKRDESCAGHLSARCGLCRCRGFGPWRGGSCR